MIILDIQDLSKAIVSLYNDGHLNKSQMKYYYDEIINKKQYKNVANFLYKRNYLEFEPAQIANEIEKAYTIGSLRRSLYLSFLMPKNKHMATMYLIKNDHILYVKGNEIIDQPESIRKNLKSK